MPARDSRDRVAEAPIIAGQEPATDEGYSYETAQANEAYEAEMAAIRGSDMPNQERPPEARVVPVGYQPPPREVLLGWGLSDAEILKIMRGAAAATNGGMVEYDEDREAEGLEKLREQRHRIAIVDNGQGVQSQLSGMERYFTGLDEKGAAGDPAYMRGKCRRLRYMSPRDEVVGINGYIFRIPRHKEVLIPTEVIDLIEKAAKSRGDFDVVSAAFQARSREPIDLHEGIANPEPLSDYYQEPRSEPQGYRPYPVGSLGQ